MDCNSCSTFQWCSAGLTKATQTHPELSLMFSSATEGAKKGGKNQGSEKKKFIKVKAGAQI